MIIMVNFKMDKIVLASNNSGKIQEIREMLRAFSIQLIPQSELNISEVEETGFTYVENAIIKARHAAKHSGLPALADDSGISVDYLNGEPGVHSARYAGKNATASEKIEKLLREMKNVPSEKRTASFHCIIALLKNEKDPAPIICHGTWKGKLLFSPKGNKGFGYDPIFFVPSHHCSAAELDLDIKNQISHRAKALKQFLDIFSPHNLN